MDRVYKIAEEAEEETINMLNVYARRIFGNFSSKRTRDRKRKFCIKNKHYYLIANDKVCLGMNILY